MKRRFRGAIEIWEDRLSEIEQRRQDEFGAGGDTKLPAVVRAAKRWMSKPKEEGP